MEAKDKFFKFNYLDMDAVLGKTKNPIYNSYIYKERIYNGEFCVNGEPHYLLREKWGQKWPYNIYRNTADMDNEGYNGHKPLGCAATALGMLLHYYRRELYNRGEINYVAHLADDYVYDANTNIVTGYKYRYECKSGSISYKYNLGYRECEVELEKIKSFFESINKYVNWEISTKKGTMGDFDMNDLESLFAGHCSKNDVSDSSYNRIATLLYESIILNDMPIIARIRENDKSFLLFKGMHYIIIDGVHVNRRVLESTQDFNKACMFHANWGWGHNSFDGGFYSLADMLANKKAEKFLKLYRFAPSSIARKVIFGMNPYPITSQTTFRIYKKIENGSLGIKFMNYDASKEIIVNESMANIMDFDAENMLKSNGQRELYKNACSQYNVSKNDYVALYGGGCKLQITLYFTNGAAPITRIESFNLRLTKAGIKPASQTTNYNIQMIAGSINATYIHSADVKLIITDYKGETKTYSAMQGWE